MSLMSLSGGQGKTTTTLFLAKLLSSNYSVCVVDADSLHNTSTFLDCEVSVDQVSLLEVMMGRDSSGRPVAIRDGIYQVERDRDLYLIPSDNALDAVQRFLEDSGIGALSLRLKLNEIANQFQFCLIDSPPQRSPLSKAILGASDFVLIPLESSAKGINALVRTLEFIDDAKLHSQGIIQTKLLGITPFREKWVGRNLTNESKQCVDALREAYPDKLFPSIRESEQLKQALSKGVLQSEVDPDLLHPFRVIADRLVAQLNNHARPL
ncbi:MAG TPA: ParA family protein [Allocoleopsis sp.]